MRNSSSRSDYDACLFSTTGLPRRKKNQEEEKGAMVVELRGRNFDRAIILGLAGEPSEDDDWGEKAPRVEAGGLYLGGQS